MATVTAQYAYHGTLATSTVDTVTLTDNTGQLLEVYNKSTSDFIYFTRNRINPTVGGADTFVVGPGQVRNIYSPGTPDVIKLISSGTPAYSVTGLESSYR